jgi:two-component system, OmpR family, sensor histidine kinase BaeS
MSFVAGLRTRVRAVSLRRRLPASFAAVALLTMIVLGAILVPVLNHHYARSESSYLRAGSAGAAEDLSDIDWTAIAVGNATTAQTDAAARRVQVEALFLQMRVQVLAPGGSVLADSGEMGDFDPYTFLEEDDGFGRHGENRGSGAGEDGIGRHLPSPVGSGLFDGDGSGDVARSSQTAEADVLSGDQVVAVLRVSQGPAYGKAVLRTTLFAWLLAGVAAVVLAALVGWIVSSRLTRPLLAITAASDGMARGDLSVRAPVDRADEIGSLAQSFNAMAETTEQTVTTLRRFVADAAHEIGTPLTALQADLELAQTQSDEHGRQRLIGRAMTQAERIAHLSSGLLRLSRLETRSIVMPLEPLDLAPLLRGLGGAVASRAEQADIAFTLDLPERPLRVRGNSGALTSAIENLLDNALKFTPAGGAVILGAKADDSGAVIWVQDTGIGIPAGDLGELFSRFHRGRNVSAYPGSGLGLAIVRATVQLHGGTISAASPAPGSSSDGSRFELRLPQA